jgi:hypothetical protein
MKIGNWIDSLQRKKGFGRIVIGFILTAISLIEGSQVFMWFKLGPTRYVELMTLVYGSSSAFWNNSIAFYSILAVGTIIAIVLLIIGIPLLISGMTKFEP